MDDIDRLLSSLSKTKFRGSFHLNNKMKKYVNTHGMNVIREHAYDFVRKRLVVYDEAHDGKQTPMRQVHPVFIAQHATGTCCRGCLDRIHHIPKNRNLNDKEVDYIVNVIMRFIELEMKNS